MVDLGQGCRAGSQPVRLKSPQTYPNTKLCMFVQHLPQDPYTPFRIYTSCAVLARNSEGAWAISACDRGPWYGIPIEAVLKKSLPQTETLHCLEAILCKLQSPVQALNLHSDYLGPYLHSHEVHHYKPSCISRPNTPHIHQDPTFWL